MSTRLDDPEYWRGRADETHQRVEQITNYGAKICLIARGCARLDVYTGIDGSEGRISGALGRDADLMLDA